MKNNKINIKRWAFTFFLALFSMITYAQTTPTTNLTAYEPNDVPAGTSFEWHIGGDSSSDLVATPETAAPGLYFGFYNYGGGCYSQPTPVRVLTNTCPLETVDLNDATNSVSGSELSFHSALPVQDDNALTGNAITEAGQGPYYVAFKTIVDGASCYSKASLIVVIPTRCIPNTTDAIDDINNTYVNVPVPGNVLTNDEDAEGNEQRVTSNTQPSNGSVTVAEDGSYVYTPNADFVGEDTFTYTIVDDGNPEATDVATVVITILPNEEGNNPPVANNDTSTTPLNTPVIISVLPNDFDPDGDTITVTPGSVTDPSNGDVVLNPDGTVTYTPEDGFVGEDTFTYQICDNGNPALCDMATVTVTVLPETEENDTFANDDAYNGNQDTDIPGSVLDNDTDAEGDDQTVNTTPVVDPTNGTVVLNSDGTFVYTPNPGYTGPDSFVYSVCDNGSPSACDEATVVLTIKPVADCDLAQTNPIYLAADCDGDGVTNGDELNPQDGEDPTNPNDPCDFITADISLSQTAAYLDGDCDGDGVTNGNELNPQDGEDPTNPNDPCDFITADISLSQTAAYLDGDCDGDGVTNGDELNPQDGEDPTNPNDPCDFITADISLSQTAAYLDGDCDGDGVTNGDELNPQDGEDPTNPNDPCDFITADISLSQTAAYLDGDCDGDGVTNGDELNPQDGEDPTNPNDPCDFITADISLSQTAAYLDGDCDGDGVTNGDELNPQDGEPATDPKNPCDFNESDITLEVTADVVCNTTKANDDDLSTEFETPVSGNVLTNDTDEEGDNTTVNPTPVREPANGTVVLNEDGTFTYTPNDGFEGEDSFVYSKCDDGTPVACDEATATIVVGEKPNTTKANDDDLSTEFETPVSGNVLTNDTDEEGDNTTVNPTPVREPANGTVVLNEDGTFTYTPNDGFEGEDSFVYSKCDDGTPVACDEATATIVVGEKPNTTKANDDDLSTEFETPVSGNVLTNDTDEEGDNTTVNPTPVREPANGTVVLNEDGTFTYTPNDGFEGEDSFVYSKCDDGTPVACDEATATIVVGEKPNTTKANDDDLSTEFETPVSGNVLTNDTDEEGDNTTVNPTPVREPANGTVVLNEDGTFTYTPNDGFEGEDSFVYSKCDDGTPVACDEATATIVVGEKPNTTKANDDDLSTEFETPVSGNVLTNDTDEEGDNTTVNPTPVREPANGTVVLNEDGTFTYTPNDGFEGEDSFVYSKCDDGTPVACDEATATIVVGEKPNTTKANDDDLSTEFETPVSGNVLTNDTDEEGDNTTVNPTPVREPANGTVVLNEDGTFTYTPNDGFEGEDSFVYSKCDDGTPVACDEATATIVVGEKPNTTKANDDDLSTEFETPVSGNVLTNDTDEEGDNTTVNPTPVREPANGTVVLNADGTFTYTPNDGFEGEDSFVYSKCDDGTPVACDEATATIVVGEKPNTTKANDDDLSTEFETPVSGNVLTNDTDEEGDNTTVNPTPVREPANGTVVLNEDGTFTYTPNDGFEGEDSFVYSKCDDGTPVACDEATATIVVGEKPNTTKANDDDLSTEFETPVSGNVLTNDTDEEGDNTTVNPTPVREPANGTVVLNEDGTFTYTPNDGFEGEDSFVYSKCDDGTPVACDEATATIVVGEKPNTTKANDDDLSTEFETPVSGNVLTNDTDEEGDNTTVNPTPVREPANGTVVLNEDGTFTYTPNDGFEGEDSFVYSKCDDGTPVACDEATATIVVGEKPNTTKANDDDLSTEFETPVSGNVLTNDIDEEGDNVTVNTTPIEEPANGTVVLNTDGTFTYTPNDGFEGEDSFMYRKCDDGTPVVCDEATVTIVVGDKPNTTKAVDDSITGGQDAPISGNVLTNDIDVEGDNQTVNTTPVEQPDSGSVVLNPDGTFVYTPDAGFSGVDTFTYSVCDDGTPQACDTATVVVTVNPKKKSNNPPVAGDDNVTTKVDTPVIINGLSNDYDSDGDAILPTGLTYPDNGTLVINKNNTVTYIPNAGFVGVDTFTYTICDDGIPSLCDTATVTVNVTGGEVSITELAAYPVPFVNTLNLKYSVHYDTSVLIEIFDMKGTCVDRYYTNSYVNGSEEIVNLDLSRVEVGVLFVTLTTDKETITKQVVKSKN